MRLGEVLADDGQMPTHRANLTVLVPSDEVDPAAPPRLGLHLRGRGREGNLARRGKTGPPGRIEPPQVAMLRKHLFTKIVFGESVATPKGAGSGQ